MRAPRVLSSTCLLTVALAGCSVSPGEGEIKESPATFSNATVRELSGTFFYIAPSARIDGTAVWHFEDGEEPRELISSPLGLSSSANISPDGSYLSWVLGEDTAEPELRVMDLAKDTELDLDITGVDPYCHEPVWTGDGQLYARPGPMGSSEPGQLYDVESGESTEVEAPEGCHVRFPPLGEGTDTLAYQPNDVSGLVFQDGDDTTELPNDALADRSIVGMTNLAADNAAACVLALGPDEPAGDPARKMTCNTILDMDSNEPVEVPNGNTDVGLFPDTGGFITRSADDRATLLRLSDAEEQDIDTVSEPNELHGGTPIAYIP